MRTLASLLAVAAIAAFGLATPAMADPNADVVESFTTVAGSSGNGTEATGGVNGSATSLGFNGGGGALILRFTDNTCLTVASSNDVTVTEISTISDDYTIAVGLIGQNLVTDGTGTGTTSFDVSTQAPVAFNRISLTATNDADGDNSGAEIDALTCLNNFDFGTAFITKTNVGSGNITIQAKGAISNGLQSVVFDITIVNTNGEDLSDIVFEDVLPAEFDLDPVAEDVADGGGIDACASGDGVCDGVMVSGGTNPEKCTATGAEHTNQGKSGKPFKLQPDIVSITDITLGDDESCEITVWAMTDQKSDKTNKVNFTPTECNEGSFIFLNEGVEVIDTMGTVETSDDVTLFVDDDQIELICTGP